MKLKTRLICNGVLTILGAIMSYVAGLNAEEHPIGEIPASVSILGSMGLMCFMCGLFCIVMIILFGDEE